MSAWQTQLRPSETSCNLHSPRRSPTPCSGTVGVFTTQLESASHASSLHVTGSTRASVTKRVCSISLGKEGASWVDKQFHCAGLMQVTCQCVRVLATSVLCVIHQALQPTALRIIHVCHVPGWPLPSSHILYQSHVILPLEGF